MTTTVRTYRDADMPSVLGLLRETLGETEVLRRTPDLFAWKHLDNPFGPSIMLLAEDGDGIVGFRAFMRWELVTPQGRVLRCARPVDTATHSRARRQGVFRRLTEAAIEAAVAVGVDLVFNTPNPRSKAGYLTMGWREVGAIGAMVRPLSHALRRTRAFPVVEGATGWGKRAPIPRPPLGLRTPREVDYLEWRFALHPTARYSVVEAADSSLAVLRSNLRHGRAELVVSDLFGPGAARAIRRAARNADAAYMVGWASRHAPERRHLVKAGMVPLPGARPLTLVARPLTSVGVDVNSLASWDLTLSDLELL